MTNYQRKKAQRTAAVLGSAATTGVLAALLADTLKVLTEHYEHRFAGLIDTSPLLVFVLPLFGLSLIHMLRYYLFRNRPNRGMTEVMETINGNKHLLPAYKIPSHYLNGFLTVISGGSTGIEVSTVVSSAAIGALSGRKMKYLRKYQDSLVCAGLAAGVTALFTAPFAGFLFAFEVFLKRRSALHTVMVVVAVSVSYLLTAVLFFKPLFSIQVADWQMAALPYMTILAILGGIQAASLTRSVLWVKAKFAKIGSPFVKVLLGAAILSGLAFAFPALYGEGYRSMEALLAAGPVRDLWYLLPLVAIMLLKPVATSVTLGAGGDGGVFAPSLFMGAFLGFILASALNYYFHLGLIPVNFMLVGMAAVLSGSIHAPLTAITLVLAIAGNVVLAIPVAIGAWVGKFTANKAIPYTVYSYRKH